MKERPILFTPANAEKVHLETKTQTRRVVRVQPSVIDGIFMHHIGGPKWQSGPPLCTEAPLGRVGDHLWVREAWSHSVETGCTAYKGANLEFLDGPIFAGTKWRHAMFMPRHRSRTLLEITEVRVQRVQEINASDCFAEGIVQTNPEIPRDPQIDFERLWDSINEKHHPWKYNPWVFAYTFRKL